MGFMDWIRGGTTADTPAPSLKAAEFSNEVIQSVRLLGGGWYFGDYGTMYSRQPAVRAVVDFLARNIGQLNCKVYDRVGDTDRVELSGHPLAVLLRRPNPVTTRYRFMRDTVADIAIYDVAYWRILRVGALVGVVRIPPSNMNRDVDSNGRVVYRDVRGNPIPRNELVVFPGYSPDGDSDGVAPLETLRRVLMEEAAAQQNRENMWNNAARQSGWIQRGLDAPEWSDAARQRFRVDLESTMTGGRNAGRVGVLEDGMTWNPSSFSPKDTEYIEGRRLTYEEVAITYGLDPSIIGMGHETKANAAEYHKQVYQDLLGPWLRFIQDEIDLQLLPVFDPLRSSTVYVEFNIQEKLKGSFEEQATTLVTAVGVPYLTINEARARLNLPRVDDEAFDRPVQPLNVLYGGQPAVTVPTADPSSPVVAAIGPPEVKQLPPPPKAAPAAAVVRRDSAAKQHEDLFRKFFERQARAVMSAKGLKADRERWDRELTADLYTLATVVTRKTGELAAAQLDGVFDPAVTNPYLAENARIAAEGINAHTFELVDAATTGEEVRHVFEVAVGARATQLALGRATSLVNFARMEAATQSERADGKTRTKTWVVTAAKSRHARLNGETVKVGEPFSNAMRYPGDAQNGSADQVAGCKCLLRLGTS